MTRNEIRMKCRSIVVRFVPILCAFLLLASFTEGRQNSADSTQQTMQVLLAGKGSQLIQKPIVLSGVTVQRRSSGKNTHPKDLGRANVPAFWVGPSANQRVLVVIPNGLVPVDMGNSTATVKPGDAVNITGTVRQAPDVTQLEAVYHLGKQEISVVQREGVIVEASAIDVRGPASRH